MLGPSLCRFRIRAKFNETLWTLAFLPAAIYSGVGAGEGWKVGSGQIYFLLILLLFLAFKINMGLHVVCLSVCALNENFIIYCDLLNVVCPMECLHPAVTHRNNSF